MVLILKMFISLALCLLKYSTKDCFKEYALAAFSVLLFTVIKSVSKKRKLNETKYCVYESIYTSAAFLEMFPSLPIVMEL
jgi:hypothetical protein